MCTGHSLTVSCSIYQGACVPHTSPPAMHDPLPCMPPCHAHTHLWTEFLTHTCENITFRNLVACGKNENNGKTQLATVNLCVTPYQYLFVLFILFKFFPGHNKSSLWSHWLIPMLWTSGDISGFHNYRPQRSWGKVMFLQASVILLTGGGAWPGPPGPGTPPPRHTPQAHPPTRHPRHTPPTRHPPRPGTLPPGENMLGDTINVRAVRILLECNLVCLFILVVGLAIMIVFYHREYVFKSILLPGNLCSR